MNFDDEDSKMAMPSFIEFIVFQGLNQTRDNYQFESKRVQDLWVLHRFAFRRGFKMGVDETCKKFEKELS